MEWSIDDEIAFFANASIGEICASKTMDRMTANVLMSLSMTAPPIIVNYKRKSSHNYSTNKSVFLAITTKNYTRGVNASNCQCPGNQRYGSRDKNKHTTSLTTSLRFSGQLYACFFAQHCRYRSVCFTVLTLTPPRRVVRKDGQTKH